MDRDDALGWDVPEEEPTVVPAIGGGQSAEQGNRTVEAASAAGGPAEQDDHGDKLPTGASAESSSNRSAPKNKAATPTGTGIRYESLGRSAAQRAEAPASKAAPAEGEQKGPSHGRGPHSGAKKTRGAHARPAVSRRGASSSHAGSQRELPRHRRDSVPTGAAATTRIELPPRRLQGQRSRDSHNDERPIAEEATPSQSVESVAESQTQPAACAQQSPPERTTHRIVVISGVEGRLSAINEMARKSGARAVIHTGNFGLYDADSYGTVSIADLRYALEEGLGADTAAAAAIAGAGAGDDEVRDRVKKQPTLLSELPDFIQGRKRLDVPVYVVWGQHEDIAVIERLRRGVYHVPNLYVLDHRTSFAISSGTTTLRLFGLGGAFSYPRLFDVGKGNDLVSGADGRVWSTLLQMGELLDLAERHDDHGEVRVFVTQTAPGREPLARILAGAIKAQFTISSAGSSPTCSVYSDRAVHTPASLEHQLGATREDLKSMWDQVYFACNAKFTEAQRTACQKLVGIIGKPGIAEQDLNMTHISVAATASQVGAVSIGLADAGLVIETVLEIETEPHQVGATPTNVEPPSAQDEHHGAATAAAAVAAASARSAASSQLVNDVRSETDKSPAFYVDTKPENPDLQVFMTNLPLDSTPEDVERELLSSYAIDSVSMVGMRGRNCVIAFRNKEDRDRALVQLENARMGDRNVSVRPNQPKLPSRLPPAKHPELCIRLRGLPRELRQDEVKNDLFRGYHVTGVEFEMGFAARVTFAGVEEAGRALRKADGLRIAGRTIHALREADFAAQPSGGGAAGSSQ